MSAPSGIAVGDDLQQSFNASITGNQNARFIFAAIRNESIALDQTLEPQGSFEDDLSLLQDALKPDTPAYILAKLDGPSNTWISISYVPDIANIRPKMLYAASRAAITKELGSSYFVDNIFATSKGDLTLEAYEAHLAHNAAPKPLSAKEREIQEAREAEKGAEPVYEGSRARRNHVGNPIGFPWDPKTEAAIQSFAENHLVELIILTIDVATETLHLHSQETEISVNAVGSKLPQSEAVYALYRWKHTESEQAKEDIVFIYSCPTSSPVKLRMLYSSGIGTLVNAIKGRLGPEQPIAKRIELSDPDEVNENFIRLELGYGAQSDSKALNSTDNNKRFARPKAPARKR